MHILIFKKLSLNLQEVSALESTLLEKLEGIDFDIDLDEYCQVLEFITSSIEIDKSQENAKVYIIRPLEAKFRKFDFVIIPTILDDTVTSKESFLIPSVLKSPYRKDNKIQITFSAFDFINIFSNKNILINKAETSHLGGISRWVEVFLYASKYHNLNSSELPYIKEIEIFWSKKEELLNNLKNKEIKLTQEHLVESISVSGITLLLRDPYSYYLEYILKVKKPDPLYFEEDGKYFGVLIHKALADVDLYSLESRAFFKKDFLLHLDKYKFKSNVSKSLFVNKKFDEIINWSYNYECTINKIKLKDYKEIKGEYCLTLNENTSIKIKAVADRIISFTDSFIIIDYKTGYIPTKKEVRDLIYPQLLIEALIMKRCGFLNIDYKDNLEIKVAFVDLRKKSKNRFIEIDTGNLEDFEKILSSKIVSSFSIISDML